MKKRLQNNSYNILDNFLVLKIHFRHSSQSVGDDFMFFFNIYRNSDVFAIIENKQNKIVYKSLSVLGYAQNLQYNMAYATN